MVKQALPEIKHPGIPAIPSAEAEVLCTSCAAGALVSEREPAQNGSLSLNLRLDSSSGRDCTPRKLFPIVNVCIWDK